METCLSSHQLFHINSNWGYDVDSVVIATTLPPAGQTPKQQGDPCKQETVEGPGTETPVGTALSLDFNYFIMEYSISANVLVCCFGSFIWFCSYCLKLNKYSLR